MWHAYFLKIRPTHVELCIKLVPERFSDAFCNYATSYITSEAVFKVLQMKMVSHKSIKEKFSRQCVLVFLW